jgi:hypothetical protein
MSDSKQPKSKPPPPAPKLNPKGGDVLLKRLLQSKPKPHKELVAERKAKRGER